MIKGFEEETAPLSDYERNELLPVMVRCLKTKVGKANEVTNAHMVSAMRKYKYIINQSRVRKIINHIRNNDLVPCLIATNGGYYVATDEKELQDYEATLLGREKAIAQIREALHRQKEKVFKNR